MSDFSHRVRKLKLLQLVDSLLYRIPIIGKRFYLRQFSRYIFSGGAMTFVDFGAYIFLTRAFLFWQTHYLWANFISMSVGAIGSFILNKNWVFKHQGKKIVSQYIMFWLIAAAGGMIFYQILFVFFSQIASIYDILSKAMAAIIVLFYRFVVQKFWIFK